MIGMIHVVLFDLIEEIGGREAVAKVLGGAGLKNDMKFNVGQVYSDEEWRAIFKSALRVLNLSENEAYDAYAEAFINDAKKRWSKWFEMSKNSMEFIKRQPKIHNGFAMGLRDSSDRNKVQKKFRFEESGNKIIVHYISDNKHCGLFKSLAYQLALEYEDDISINESTCMLQGQDECVIELMWNKIKNK